MTAAAILIAALAAALALPVWLGLGLPVGPVREHPRPINEIDGDR